MMKKLAKLTKAALLATATAFLLAGFPACSSDDNDPIPIPPPKEVSAELDAEVGELTAGTPKTVNATVTVDGDTFSTTAKSIGQGEGIPEDNFALEADDVEVSAATLVEWVDDSTAKISFTVTANANSEGGKIHALIKAGTLATCTKVVTTNSVIYTVKGKEPPAGLTKTVRFFNDANATTAIHTVTVATGERLTETQLEAAESNLSAPKGKEFEKWDGDTTAAITEDKDFHAIWKDAEATGTTYAWNFQAEGLKSILSYTNNSDDKPQLDAAGTYESTPAGLTLNLPEGGVFNKVEPNTDVAGTVNLDDATKGFIEPDGKTLLTVDVKGPVTAVMLCAANASEDKSPAKNNGRYAYIKVGDEEVCAPYKETNTLHAAGEKLSYTYEGSDTVTVGFGGTDYVRIHDIQITTKNGDGTGKTDGEVKSKATFVSQPNDTTANDEATLGLVGTSAESSDEDVATVNIDGGKIVITSVSAGTATITVKDGDKEATIEVTVSGTGNITIVKITKYVNTAEIFTVENGALNLLTDSYEYYLSIDNLKDTTGNNAWSTASADALANTASKAGKTTFTETNTVVNMSKPARNITLKVKNVAAIDVHVYDSNGNRDYTVKVGSTDAVTYKTVKNVEGNVIKTNTTDEVEIVIAGVSESVYPVGVILYKTAPTAEE